MKNEGQPGFVEVPVLLSGGEELMVEGLLTDKGINHYFSRERFSHHPGVGGKQLSVRLMVEAPRAEECFALLRDLGIMPTQEPGE